MWICSRLKLLTSSQDDLKDGAALLGGKAGRPGIVLPGQEKHQADLIVTFQCLKELTGNMERGCLQGMEGQDKAE
ncbi:hypothetical protein DUI87_14590 [Hirundo rustica rustica]|uniref:Uncharacterized protein n=1 Tax=Hirundo rustica rustica TaxID=333673 RepID=A0A3M0K5E7_HIRRU|nr:hypothetical protein DUI87_14590 [Hirundo rustica rustica]